MEEIIKEIYQGVVKGNALLVKTKIETALQSGFDAELILSQGLIEAMREVGRLFENHEYFVPDMLISARAMQAGVILLQPSIVEQGVEPTGKVVLGTVKGDLHNIGKNLVKVMLEGNGFQVIDLGTDVSAEKFVDAIQEHQPDIVGLSALLTTTMSNIPSIIKAIEDAGQRSLVKVMIGGAPVTQSYAEEVRADGYAPNASQAVTLAKALLGK